MLVFQNASIFDGTGQPPYGGSVLIEGNRIVEVVRGSPSGIPESALKIDARGATLMPGLVESHGHLSFGSTVECVLPLGPHSMELRLLRTAMAARVMLDYGYTSCYSGGSVNAAGEVALRDEIAAGRLPGPRIRACSFERAAGSASVVAKPGQVRTYAGTAGRDSDPVGMRDFVKEMADTGVDSIKMLLSGESAVVLGTSMIIQFYEEEVEAAADEARKHGLRLNAHTHSPESILMGLRHGFDVLYHCTVMNEQALTALASQKDRIFVAPGIGVNWFSVNTHWPSGTPEKIEQQKQTMESVRMIAPRLRDLGVRYLPGGDYGFPHTPIGRNAKDLELFVDYLGIDSLETLHAATLLGGQLMGMDGELGAIAPGYLADLLLVDGDVTKDITLLQDKARILAVMKDGQFHRSPPSQEAEHQGTPVTHVFA